MHIQTVIFLHSYSHTVYTYYYYHYYCIVFCVTFHSCVCVRHDFMEILRFMAHSIRFTIHANNIFQNKTEQKRNSEDNNGKWYLPGQKLCIPNELHKHYYQEYACPYQEQQKNVQEKKMVKQWRNVSLSYRASQDANIICNMHQMVLLNNGIPLNTHTESESKIKSTDAHQREMGIVMSESRPIHIIFSFDCMHIKCQGEFLLSALVNYSKSLCN